MLLARTDNLPLSQQPKNVRCASAKYPYKRRDARFALQHCKRELGDKFKPNVVEQMIAVRAERGFTDNGSPPTQAGPPIGRPKGSNLPGSTSRSGFGAP